MSNRPPLILRGKDALRFYRLMQENKKDASQNIERMMKNFKRFKQVNP